MMTTDLRNDPGFREAARIAVQDCLAVKAGETVLVVTDAPLYDIGRLLWEASKAQGADAQLIEIMPREVHGEEPPAPVAAAMKAAQVVFCPTSKSLSHTEARRQASAAGARIATLPNILPETFRRAVAADYAAIARRSAEVAGWLTNCKQVHLTTPAGTDLTFSLEGREGDPDTGMCHQPGQFSNLPAGEAYAAPLEGTANGVAVIDGTMLETRLTEDPVRLVFRDGVVVEYSGHPDVVAKLKAIVAKHGTPALVLAELGIGTNEKAELCGNTLEDEKILGTVHLAIGDNTGFGGKNRVASHQDGILLRPTLILDGKKVMEDGRLFVKEA